MLLFIRKETSLGIRDCTEAGEAGAGKVEH